ncbi:MAG: hypothetical protein KC619_34090 [Myxococcales bacterium]|nr:hypothetical protein [Myxococcales bacterium]
MTPLFVSQVCDWCDGLAAPETLHTGYIVWRARALPSMEYVFPSPEEARKWGRARGFDQAPIRPVQSLEPFRWRRSSGSLKDVTLADHLYEIHPDRRFAPQPHRAWVA